MIYVHQSTDCFYSGNAVTQPRHGRRAPVLGF
jgi:hypothetical protein